MFMPYINNYMLCVQNSNSGSLRRGFIHKCFAAIFCYIPSICRATDIHTCTHTRRFVNQHRHTTPPRPSSEQQQNITIESSQPSRHTTAAGHPTTDPRAGRHRYVDGVSRAAFRVSVSPAVPARSAPRVMSDTRADYGIGSD